MTDATSMTTEDSHSSSPPNVSVELVYPPTPQLTPQVLLQLNQTDGMVPTSDGTAESCVDPAVSSLLTQHRNLHGISIPLSSESSGLVLLSHLCALSAKQPNASPNSLPVAEEVEITETEPDPVPEYNHVHDHFTTNASQASVIVEKVPHDDIVTLAPSPWYSSEAAVSPESEDGDDSMPSSEPDVKPPPTKKAKRVTKTLKFPPCFVCGGNASGSHYGVNSCEACKGFFRRYLMRNEDYKCGKGGNCEIINRNRGNCSGCRLKKCLLLGMAKEKSKLGRYTLARRTETIKEVNKLEGKEETDSVSEGKVRYPHKQGKSSNEHLYFDPKVNIISRKMSEDNENIEVPEVFTKQVIACLVMKLRELKPFGPNINNDKDIEAALKRHHERYKVKTEIFGNMTTIPSDEYYQIYKEFGIDTDGRIEYLRQVSPYIEGIIERYCVFAKHIPEFLQLSFRDQSNLLKTARYDFFVLAMHHGYSEEYQMMLGKNGLAYHIEETADKFCSKKLVLIVGDMYKRWQKLNLNWEEMAIICALTLVSTDRCKLENYSLVEKIQFSIVQLLQEELRKTCLETSQKRFSKIIDNLTMMREGSELYLREYKQLCKNKVIIDEMPIMSEFLLEDDEEEED